MSATREFEAPPRSLPIVAGREHLDFRCTGCGNCCRDLRVTVTHHDVLRLAAATNEPQAALVDWLSPEQVDMSGEPGSFVELSSGRRLMVLAQRHGACRWLGEDARCGVYTARPADCRQYPFSLEARADGDGAVLSLLASTRCDYAHDGEQNEHQITHDDARRFGELAEYQALVANWNRLAQHRRRLGHRARGADDFFSFISKKAG